MSAIDSLMVGFSPPVSCQTHTPSSRLQIYDFFSLQHCDILVCNFVHFYSATNNFDPEKYAKQQERFGTIVFESDADLPPKTIYKCYEERWLLELVFAQYKGDECLDKTSVQGDFSVIGSEFINFIATIATCRIIRKASDAKLLDKISYGELMDDLSSAWRKVDVPTSAPDDIPTSNDGGWIHTLPMVFEELEVLGLSRPAANSQIVRKKTQKKSADPTTPKRPRGRPRKDRHSI